MTSDTTGRVLDFLRRHFAEHGLAPTRREIADSIGARSVITVDHYLRKLSSQGLIELTQDTSRNIRLKDPTHV